MKAAAAGISGAAILVLAYLPAGADAVVAQNALAKFTSAWDAVQTYQCTITSHEIKGRAVQDRVYHFYFSKPFDTRAEIVSGDGRGSVGVWHGGNRVRGHRGGLLHGIILNVDLHSGLATTLRGTTFAESNVGALLTHLRSLAPKSLDAKTSGNIIVLTAHVDPSKTDGVTKETYYFGANDWPLEYDQYQGNELVKRAVYSDVKTNVRLGAGLLTCSRRS